MATTKKETIIKEKTVKAPKVEAKEAPKATVKDYVSTKESMEAFAKILQDNAGRSTDDVRDAWENHLTVKLGVTNPTILLPQTVISSIEDAFKAGGQIWNRVVKTNADVWRAAWDTVTGEESRAKGHVAGAAKTEQDITIADRVLRPGMVYKFINLNKEDIKAQKSTGALVAYVLSELPRRIVREVERAIVIGDGRANDSAYKISSFTSVKSDVVTGNVFAQAYTPAVGESRYSAVLKANDKVTSEGGRVLVAKKGYLTGMLLEQASNGSYLFAPGSDLGRVLGFDEVVEPDWMQDDAEYDAYIVDFSGYKTVGDTSLEAFTNFKLETNQQQYLQELYAGGGLTVLASACGIAVTPAS